MYNDLFYINENDKQPWLSLKEVWKLITTMIVAQQPQEENILTPSIPRFGGWIIITRSYFTLHFFGVFTSHLSQIIKHKVQNCTEKDNVFITMPPLHILRTKNKFFILTRTGRSQHGDAILFP